MSDQQKMTIPAPYRVRGRKEKNQTILCITTCQAASGLCSVPRPARQTSTPYEPFHSGVSSHHLQLAVRNAHLLVRRAHVLDAAREPLL